MSEKPAPPERRKSERALEDASEKAVESVERMTQLAADVRRRVTPPPFQIPRPEPLPTVEGCDAESEDEKEEETKPNG